MERKQNSIMKYLAVTGLTMVLALGYTNCSVLPSDHSGSLSALDACGEDLYQVFQNIIHPMTTQQCSKCHVPGGSAKGDFAQQDVDLAFESFYAIGIDKVTQYAVDAGHNAPYTGAINDEDVQEALDEWEVIKPQCEIRGGAQFFSSYQPMVATPTNGSAEYTFNFDSAGFPGMTVTVLIERVVNGNSITYRLSNPEVTAGAEPIQIRGLVFYLNDEYQELALSFAGVNQVISPGVPEPFDGIEIVGALDPTTDQLQVGFIELSIADLD